MFLRKLSLVLTALTAWQAHANTTTSGIPLDAEWKRAVYAFAQKNIVHPSWGISHSERNYQTAKLIAEQDRIPIDLDVLFAAAFLHDWGGIGSFAKPGVDHAVRSVELAEPFLQQVGFPPGKWPGVKEMILGHTYYGPEPASGQAFAFRDADLIDFLGDIGIARIFAATQDPGQAGSSLKAPIALLQSLLMQLPPKLHCRSATKLAERRVWESKRFLNSIRSETFDGTAS